MSDFFERFKRDRHWHRRSWVGQKRRRKGKIQPGHPLAFVRGEEAFVLKPTRRVPVGKRRERRGQSKP